ncbi:hypothetical protein SETIT_3G096500v2 [Setaria italica]|nr:hypothetical protein SETIT_3G096500v2 [Setaria italica]
MAAVFVYPSLSVTWTAGTSASWEALGLHQEERMTPPSWWSSYVYGCLYCKALKSNKFLKLDVNRMEFSAVSLLPNHENRQVLVVEAGEGKIGIPGRIFGQEIPESWRYSIRRIYCPTRLKIHLQNKSLAFSVEEVRFPHLRSRHRRLRGSVQHVVVDVAISFPTLCSHHSCHREGYDTIATTEYEALMCYTTRSVAALRLVPRVNLR